MQDLTQEEKIGICKKTIEIKNCAMPEEIKCSSCFLNCGFQDINGENAAVVAARKYLVGQGVVRYAPEYNACAVYQEGDRITRNGKLCVYVLVRNQDGKASHYAFVPVSELYDLP